MPGIVRTEHRARITNGDLVAWQASSSARFHAWVGRRCCHFVRRETSADQKIDEIQTMNQQQIDDMNSQFGATSKQRQSEVEQVMQQHLCHQVNAWVFWSRFPQMGPPRR